jgi:hypothetical protein
MISLPFVWVMFGGRGWTNKDIRKERPRGPHISRLQQSNLSLLIRLDFLFIAACWIAHPREFLFLIFRNRLIQSSGVNSTEHAVQPSPALWTRIPS